MSLLESVFVCTSGMSSQELCFLKYLTRHFHNFKDYFPPTELSLSICPLLFVVSFLPPSPHFLIFSVMVKGDTPVIRVFIRHWRSENYPFTMQKSAANVRKPMTILHSDVDVSLFQNILL